MSYTSPWVTVHIPNPDASMRLLCFPYAGSGPAVFRLWPRGLPSEVEVCPVALPGRESRMREPGFTRIDALIEPLAGGLKFLLDKPFAFFGHSLGALVTFELTRFLRRKGWPMPLQLFVSGRKGPQLPSFDPPITDLPEEEFVSAVQTRYGGIPDAVLRERELLRLLLPAMRADLEMVESYAYSPETSLDQAISVFGGMEDQLAARDELEAWRDLTRAEFALRLFPGGHFFLNSQREALLQELSEQLRKIL